MNVHYTFVDLVSGLTLFEEALGTTILIGDRLTLHDGDEQVNGKLYEVVGRRHVISGRGTPAAARHRVQVTLAQR